MNQLPKRKAFNFYSSYDEAFEVLSEKNQIKLFKAIRDVQFFRIHINDIEFTETDLKFAWLIIKHSVESQVFGYCRANKVDYNNAIKDTLGVSLEDTILQEQEQEQEKVKEKEEEKVVVFSFSLTRETSYENLSLEYREKLKEEIEKLNLSLSFIDFVDSLVAKGYKYKNFLMAYKTWCKKDFNTSKKTTNNSFGGWSE